MTFQHKRSYTALGLVAGLALSACSTTPDTNADLQAAQEAVQRAQQNPSVTQYAPEQLKEAQTTLDIAQQGWDEYGNDREEDVDHLSYVAQQQALAAIELAAAGEARASIENADSRRAQALLDARERELAAAREQARINEEDAAQLRGLVEELKAQETERGLILTMDEILFDFDGSELKPGGVNAIQRLAEFLKQNPGRAVLIEGHTDAVGAEGYNVELSERRAQAVRDQLASFGVEESQIQTKGYGEDFPVANNDTSAGRQQNRRVEVVIADQGQEPELRSSETTSALENR